MTLPRSSNLPTSKVIECDVVIAGSGMGGMNAAIQASRSGAYCIVLEKDNAIGGNSKWAGGFDLQASTFERMRTEHPEGDPDIQKALVDHFLKDIEYLKGLGLEFRIEWIGEDNDPRFNYMPHSGEGGIRVFKIFRAHLEEAGGQILLQTALKRLLTDDAGNIVGVMAIGPEGPVKINCRAVVLATGSFSRNSDLKLRYFGPNADRTSYYGTDHHDGDGIMAALEVGAALSTGISIGQGMCLFPPPFKSPSGVYRLGGDSSVKLGSIYAITETDDEPSEDPNKTSEPVPAGVQNLIIRPPCTGDVPVIMVNLDGKRYVDESTNYTVVGWKTTTQPLGYGFCIFDHDTYIAKASILETASEWGAVIYKANTIENLAAQLKNWRVTPAYVEQVNSKNMIATVKGFNRAISKGKYEDLYPPREGQRVGVERSPFYAIPVVQGVVDSVGGLKINQEARVLDRGGDPIVGLFAAGADAGRAYSVEHGGIAFGLVFGRIAGANATRLAIK
jgi:hypothetical protein